MRDLYQDVTNRIVAALEAGTPPWVRPWSVASLRPRNAVSDRPYRGINHLLLGLEAFARGYPDNRWLTFRQAAEQGAYVRAGEQGTTVVFYKPAVGNAAPAEGDAPASRGFAVMRAFTVFNVAQIEDLGLSSPQPASWDAHREAEALLVGSKADIHHGGEHAYYHRRLDEIHLPPRNVFTDRGAYYATALHELVHWTGHEKRCNRDLKGRFGDLAYAAEELIAELGSAFLCAHCRVDGSLQHPAYVRAWLPMLKEDKRAIFTAAAKAQAAADFVLGASQSTDTQEVAA